MEMVFFNRLVSLFAGNAALFFCEKCHRSYRNRSSLVCHLRYECGIPPRLTCSYCPYKSHRPGNLDGHIRRMHPGVGYRASRKSRRSFWILSLTERFINGGTFYYVRYSDCLVVPFLPIRFDRRGIISFLFINISRMWSSVIIILS